MYIRINGNSLEGLLDDQSIYEFEESSTPDRGDVIAFNVGHELLVKRVYGAPGDHIEIRENNELNIGTFLLPLTDRQKSLIELFIHDYGNSLPENSFFVLGTKQHDSRDSRSFGYISREDIVGKLKLNG